MAVKFRNNSATSSYNNVWLLPTPPGTQNGDWIVIWGFFPQGAVGSVTLENTYGFTQLNNAMVMDNGVQVWMFTWVKKANNEPLNYQIENWDGVSNYAYWYAASFSGVAANGGVVEGNPYAQIDANSMYGAFNNPAGGGYLATTYCGSRQPVQVTSSPNNGWTQQFIAGANGAFGTSVHTYKELIDGGISSWFSFISSNSAIASMTVVLGPGVNTAPGPPTLVGPANNSVLDRTAVNRFSWIANDDPWDSQSGYQFRYRIVGNATWTTGLDTTSPSAYHDAAGGTFTAGNYEWQVRTRDQSGTFGPYSGSGFFTAADPPAGPSITAPVNGATVDAAADVTWSTASQDSYQLRRVADNAGVADTATVYFDTGEVASSTTRSRSVSFEVNQRWEHVQIRVKSAGLWSAWSSVRVLVSYTPPPVPTVALSADNATGSIIVGITNPTPGAGEPATVYNDIYVDDGDGRGFTRRRLGAAPNATWTYYVPRSGFDYAGRIFARAIGDNGSTSDSVHDA